MLEISEIIRTIETSNANVNPTEIYNEGWMTRLLVYYSFQEKIKLEEIDFALIKNWTSEALLSSPFVGVSKIREGYTHADIALGDFTVNYEVTGKLRVNDDAEIFGVIEAKMGSPLSKLTTNAPDYNQASRSVACIAHNTVNDCKTFFYVVLPKSKVVKGNRAKISISDLVKIDKIKTQIENRFGHHNSNNEAIINEFDIIEKAEKCIVGIITYEDWIDLFINRPQIRETLEKFYTNCKKWNKL